MDIGISGLVLPSNWSAEETFGNVRAAGYTAFELAMRDGSWLSATTSDDELRQVAKLAAQHELDLVSVCPALRERPRDLMTADAAARTAAMETVRDCLRTTSMLGVDTMLLVLGRLTPALYYDVAWDNALAAVRELAKDAEQLGVRLAIEYVWNQFLLSPMEFAAFLDQVGSDHVGFYFDSGNMVHMGYPEHWVRICGRHLMAVHLKDFRRHDRAWMPLLEGDVDFAAVMAELRQLDFTGPLVSEVEIQTAALKTTAAAIDKIRQLT